MFTEADVKTPVGFS